MISAPQIVDRWGVTLEELSEHRRRGTGPECYVVPGTRTPRYLLHEVDDYFTRHDPGRRPSWSMRPRRSC
jgi:hypothetical protein